MNPELFGDEILALISSNLKYLGIAKKSWEAVYGGFWDIYCKRPQSSDLNPKKLEGFVPRVKLVTPP